MVVVLTRQVGDLGPGWGYFLAAGASPSDRGPGGLADEPAHVPAADRGDGGDRADRLGGPGKQGAVHGNDYTEFSSLARSINEMAQSLEDGRDRERQLLLSVSHDLRTPLTSIRGFAEAITDGAIDDTTQAAEVIIAESRRLERLVGDLLELGKLEAKQLSIHIRPTDVAEVVGTTAEGFRPLAEKGGLHLSVHVPTREWLRGGRPRSRGPDPGQPH